MTPKQLDEEDEDSGRKCKDILADYEDAIKKANDMKTWFLFFHDCPNGM